MTVRYTLDDPQPEPKPLLVRTEMESEARKLLEGSAAPPDPAAPKYDDEASRKTWLGESKPRDEFSI